MVDKNFNVLKLNQSLSILSGITMDEAKGKKCYETFPSSLCNTPKCVLARILGGELIGMVESITDITARKKVENELQDTMKDLRKVLRGTIQAIEVNKISMAGC